MMRVGCAIALALVSCGGSKATTTVFGDVGRSCDLGVPADAGAGEIATVTSPALDCLSRICIFGPAQKASDTGPLCTAACTNDAQCATDQRRDPNTPGDRRCQAGFACMVPTTVGIFKCQRLCVCIDSLVVPPGGFTNPAVCADAGA